MLFLPGTAFAVRCHAFFGTFLLADISQAILSMPFFDEDPWLGKASRVWVWFALTTPSTIFAVLFYVLHSRRAWKKRINKHVKHEDADDIGMEATV
jgi:hypothetical protein